MERVTQNGEISASNVAKHTGADLMIVFDDLILSLLSSAIVTYVNRGDEAIDEAQKERLEDLKRRVESLRKWDSPEQQVTTLFNEALRDHRQSGSPGAALVKIVPTDPVWGMELTQWLLEADPKEFACKLDNLATRLAEASNCEQSAVAAFLTRVSQRIDNHLGLSQLRADKKLNLILDRLQGLEELRGLVERNQFTILGAFRKWLTDEQRKVLVPVCPVARDRTERNSLLSGARPTFKDMDENLDFERFEFPNVITAIKAADRFPCAFLFKAESQRGKTTFLHRVGCHLAQHGYPVLRLAEGARAEPYAHWIEACAREQTTLPLVVLIDDPAKQGEHFTNQLEDLRQSYARVLILLASQPADWTQVNTDLCALTSDKYLWTFDLNPQIGEAQRLLEKLVSRGLLGVDKFDEVITKVEAIPIGEGYFHHVIELATDNRNRSISTMVEEALREAGGSPEADAFERFYALVCVPGMLGLSLPESVAQVVFPDDTERARALAFNEQLLRPAIRVADSDYSATHEVYAARFLVRRDFVAKTRLFVRAFVAQPRFGDYVGLLLELQSLRDLSKMVLMLWDEIADQITDDHWQACSANALTRDWGSLLFHLGRMQPSLRANAIAVEKAPEDPVVHNNYAILLEEHDEHQAARIHFKKALSINSEYAEAHNNYAGMLASQREWADARKHFKEALRINPEYAEAHYNYAVLLILLENPEDSEAARNHFEEALRLNPDHAEAHFNYARLLVELNDPQPARVHFEEAVRIDPEHAAAHANYAHFLLAQGDSPLSLDHAVRAIRLQTLPDGGTRIPEWFSDHVDDLFQIVELSDATAERRGGALAFLAALADERAEELLRQCEDDSGLAPAADVCKEIHQYWMEIVQGDTTEPPSGDALGE